MSDKVSVSVVIPVYNGEDYIMECLRSVLAQTFQDFEIIVIDDGSTDATLSVVNEVKKYTDKIVCFTIENHGQGYARNYALQHCRGEYICFVDADDVIEPYTLELAYARIQEDGSDLVVYDWKYLYTSTATVRYNNVARYFSKRILQGEECLALLETNPFFTVNKLYSRRFLQENNIRYGEGYIYEDIPFWTNICVHAQKVSLIHSPLYSVRVSGGSTTQTNLETDRHSHGFIQATKASLSLLDKVEKEEYQHLYYYLFVKFGLYYDRRTAGRFQKAFARDFVDLMAEHSLVPTRKSRFYNACIRYRVFEKQRYVLFRLMLFWRFRVFPEYQKRKKACQKRWRNLFRKKKRSETQSPAQQYGAMLKQSLFRDVILFMGFDYRYTGNSRYLFEEMLRRDLGSVKVFFATDDPRVPSQYRIQPHSERFYKFVARSKVVIFESWAPLSFKKRLGAVWIQLWHGTPLKKMLFDSEESNISAASPRHKNNKYKDILRWDAMITDAPQVGRFFETSMLLPKSKLFNFGYPRVKFLLDNAQNESLKAKIKEIYHIPENKKIVAYLPTWRDYNYNLTPEEYDMDYLLDVSCLLDKLPEDYLVLHKKHQFKANDVLVEEADDRIINANDIETQELLLIADCLVTDYSSVLFDALAIDLPVVIYANDFDKYQKSRSVYPDLWKMLTPFVNSTIEDAAAMIRRYPMGAAYQELKEGLSYQNTQGDMVSWVADKLMLPM